MSAVLIDELPPAHRLALAWSPARSRAPVLAVLALDNRLATILRKRREPLLVQMRLAWWRDMLGQPATHWPQGDAVLDALRHWGDPAALVPLVDGWEALLAEDLQAASIAEFAAGRGAAFAAVAQELGRAEREPARKAAQVWALADLAANLSNAGERQQVLDHARGLPAAPRLPRALRSLAVLAGLARPALATGGAPLLAGPRSALLALRIGLAGR